MTLRQQKALKTALEKRVLNEFGSKILNEERLDVAVSRRPAGNLKEHAKMDFYCECADAKCREVISMSTEEYQRIHRRTKHFMVIPSHVKSDLEEVISSFRYYVLVAKYFPYPKSPAAS